MSVDVILMDDVEGLGVLGDQARVADGYARNYLLPKRLAVPVTPTNLRRLEARKLELQKEHEERLAVAQALAAKVARESVTIPVQATEDDKLYGSVGPVQIAENLVAAGFEVGRHAVLLDEPIRELGVYNVELQLHADVRTTVKVWVVRE